MKGVLLAGGHGTRLQPLTRFCNKHLLPIYMKDKAVPLIEFAVKQLVDLNCKDIAVVLGDFRAEDIMVVFHKYLEPKYGLKTRFYYQGEPLGIAHAVAQAKDFVMDDEFNEGFVVMLGDNVFLGETPKLTEFRYWWGCPYNDVCSIVFAKTDDPYRYGSPFFEDELTTRPFDEKTDVLKKIVEKPKSPQVNLGLTGLYKFNADFYFDAYKNLKPSARGEYELTDIINVALSLKEEEHKPNVFWSIYDGYWMDAGTFQGFYGLQRKVSEIENQM